MALLTPQGLVGETLHPQRHGHAETLMGVIQSACAQAGVALADLRLVSCVTGPGSFTGLRAGLAAAQGLGLALGCPVVGVSGFEALAQTVREQEPGSPLPLLLCLDSRRAEPFVAAGDDALRPVLPEPCFMAPERLAAALSAQGTEGVFLAGDGSPLLAPALIGAGLEVHPSAHQRPAPGVICRLGLAALAAGHPAPALPLYLRAADAVPGKALVCVQ